MNNKITKFQHFPFHLVDQSPWPIFTSFSLLNLTVGAVSYFQGSPMGGYIFTLGLVLTVAAMGCWLRDVVIEGNNTKFNIL